MFATPSSQVKHNCVVQEAKLCTMGEPPRAVAIAMVLMGIIRPGISECIDHPNWIDRCQCASLPCSSYAVASHARVDIEVGKKLNRQTDTNIKTSERMGEWG